MQGVNVQPLSQFSGQPAHAGIHSGNKDGDIGIFVGARIEERRHQGELKKIASKVEPGSILPAIPKGTNCLYYLSQLFRWFFPGDAESTLVVSFNLDKQPLSIMKRP